MTLDWVRGIEVAFKESGGGATTVAHWGYIARGFTRLRPGDVALGFCECICKTNKHITLHLPLYPLPQGTRVEITCRTRLLFSQPGPRSNCEQLPLFHLVLYFLISYVFSLRQ